MRTQDEIVQAEDFLLAVLHLVGSGVRMCDDIRLFQELHNAAVAIDSPVSSFKIDPHFGYSRKLSSTLQLLDLGGVIIRENATAGCFRVSPHAAGAYGKAKVDALSAAHRERAAEVADSIKRAFRGGSDDENAGRDRAALPEGQG